MAHLALVDSPVLGIIENFCFFCCLMICVFVWVDMEHQLPPSFEDFVLCGSRWQLEYFERASKVCV